MQFHPLHHRFAMVPLPRLRGRLGRFLQVDPVGYSDQMNLYAYVGNDSVNATDPTGKFLQVGIGAFVGAATNIVVQLAQNGGNIQKTYENFNTKSFAVAVVAGGLTGVVSAFTAGMSPIAAVAVDRLASTVIGAAAGAADVAATNPNATSSDYVKGAGLGAIAGAIGSNGGTLAGIASPGSAKVAQTIATTTAVVGSTATTAIPLMKQDGAGGASSAPPPQPAPSKHKPLEITIRPQR